MQNIRFRQSKLKFVTKTALYTAGGQVVERKLMSARNRQLAWW